MATTIVHQDLKSMFGGEDMLEVATKRSFSSLIFQLLSEQVPTDNQLQIFEMILNLSIDHGTDTPSAAEVIKKAESGASISESVARGIEQINDLHGGAIEPAMELFYKIDKENLVISDVVKNYLSEDRRVSGFGHRIYKEVDPRAQLILGKLSEDFPNSTYIKVVKSLETELEIQKGKKLPINIDGAIAVVLCNLGWDSKLGKALFIIARTPGLCGQYLNVKP